MGFYSTYGKIAQRVSYNAKGEVTVASHSTKPALNRSYEFDGIGNRKKSADSLTLPATDNYQANALNQYGSIDGNTRSFDADGNLVDDGVKQYEWDAENRLIAIKQGAATVAEYAYDFRSRRITKSVGGVETNFVYDNWNPIAEFSGSTLDKSYTWGMDLSGSMQGAGGVGGLLSVNDGSATYYPTYDGNGNVSEYVDTTGAVVAHYEYDAFGQVVASGMKKDDFSHQFSTKMLDAESGLHYYGYRYYDSSNGRWLGRDSIQERGGINIYGFVGNQGISRWDLLGLVWPGGYPINPTPYYPTNPTPPTQPNVCDQINPFGCRGDGKADYNKWLEGRFSKSIHKAKSALGVSIDTRVQKLCFNKGNTVDVSKIGYGLSNDNIEDNGDEGQSLWERAATVGSFSLYAENVSITWKEENGKCLYEWTATIYVEENTGATNPFNTNYQCYCPDLLWFTGMFVERKLRWAEWEVEGSGQCGETVYSSQ